MRCYSSYKAYEVFMNSQHPIYIGSPLLLLPLITWLFFGNPIIEESENTPFEEEVIVEVSVEEMFTAAAAPEPSEKKRSTKS
jgi:hypothetical protein